jgi:hypothetical protein
VSILAERLYLKLNSHPAIHLGEVLVGVEATSYSAALRERDRETERQAKKRQERQGQALS